MAKSRKEMEHRQRRRYILDCAEKLFAEKSFDGVTVADIAKASEFSVGSLYLFFENKEALIRELLLERMKQISDIVSKQLKADIPAKEKLENAIDGLTCMFVEHMNFFKLYMSEVKGCELHQPSEGFGAEVAKLVQDNFKALKSIFEQGIEEGAFRDDLDPLFMTLFLDASLHVLISYMYMVNEDLPLKDVRKSMQSMFYEGILKEGAHD